LEEEIREWIRCVHCFAQILSILLQQETNSNLSIKLLQREALPRHSSIQGFRFPFAEELFAVFPLLNPGSFFSFLFFYSGLCLIGGLKILGIFHVVNLAENKRRQ
jgi:hypothetical protein